VLLQHSVAHHKPQPFLLVLQVIASLTTRGHLLEAFDSIPYWRYQRIENIFGNNTLYGVDFKKFGLFD
jgi:hypothetical protein